MKPNFKTTALAILVSLGAVACSSNSSHDGAQPVKVTKPAEATKPAETTTPAEPTNPFEPTKPAEATQPVEAAKFDFKKEATLANGKEWRYIDLFSKGDAGDLVSRFIPAGNSSGVVNFNKLSNYSLGEFSGVVNDKTYILGNEVVKNGLHYHFINQPYSTYGFISNGEGLTKESPDNSYYFYVIKDSSPFEVQSPVEGVYSGDVIAKIYIDDEYHGYRRFIIKNDGKVKLDVKANPDANDKLMLSGSINSNTIGEVKLLPAEVKYHLAEGLAVLQEGVTGKYDTRFSDKYKDVVGDASIEGIAENTNLKVNIEGKDVPIHGYNAAFGGHRQ